MKIAVCVKEVPESFPTGRLDPAHFRLDRSGEGTLNAFELHALEEALRIRASAGEGQVVVVSIGRERAAEALKRTFTLGADRVVLVTDEAAVGSDLLPTSRVLAAALAREEPDLTLFGQQADDGEGGVLWAAVGERLGLPAVSKAAHLEMGEESVRVRRQTEYAYELLEAPLLCVVAVARAINEPRCPSLNGAIQARKKRVEVRSLADLGLGVEEVGDRSSRTGVLGLSEPPNARERRRVDGGEGVAEKILAFLLEKELV